MTYESGGVSSVVDYVLARKKDMKDVKDVGCKGDPRRGVCLTTQAGGDGYED